MAEAVEQGDALGERGIAADAAVALVDLRLQRTAQTGVVRQDVLRQVDSAIRVFEESGDEAGLGRAFGLAGKLRFWRGEAAAATEEFERAARYAHDAGDRVEEASSLQGILGTLLRNRRHAIAR